MGAWALLLGLGRDARDGAGYVFCNRAGNRLRILIVEDDFLIGMMLADMLEMMGHEVCATEATEAGAIAAAAEAMQRVGVVDTPSLYFLKG